MKILYGLSGDGYGHSSRAKVVGAYLKEWGHEVRMLTYGRAVDVLRDDFDIFEVTGMEIQFAKGELQKRATMLNGIRMVKENLKEFMRFHKLMTEYDPDLCISDMEPIVPIMRFWHRKPLICLDNQHRLTNLELDVPRKYYKEYLAAKTVTENFVARAEHFIITSFAEAPVKKKYADNTTIVPPVIRQEVQAVTPQYGDRVLVYMTRENKEVIDILKGMDENFVVFGYNVDKSDENLEFKVRDHFLDELKECKAIIATAGFTLMSEALYLKKPYLALPLNGQFEQVLNSLFLKQAGYGAYSDRLTSSEAKDFLGKLPEYRENLQDHDVDFNKLPDTLRKVLDSNRGWDHILNCE